MIFSEKKRKTNRQTKAVYTSETREGNVFLGKRAGVGVRDI